MRHRLLHIEQWGHMGPVSIGTFYNVVPEKIDSVINYLTTRCKEIISANPWMTYYLEKDPYDREIYLTERKNKDVTQISVFQNDKVFEQKNGLYHVKKIIKIVRPLQPDLIDICIKTKEPLFRLIVTYNSEKTKLLAMCSIHHSMGDAYTLYQIWKMFDKSSPIISMSAERDTKFLEKMTSEMGFAHHWPLIKPSKKILAVEVMTLAARNIIKSLAKPYLNRQVEYYSIASEEIEHRKSKQEPGKFVSTNDILTSWFLSKFDITCTYEAVMLRNRVPGITDRMAGSYLGILGLREDEVKSPGKHRSYLYDVLENKKQDTAWRSSLFESGGVVSNWASFYRPVSLPDAEEVFHIPLLDIARYKLFLKEAMLFVFKSNVEDTCIISFNFSNKKINFLEDDMVNKIVAFE